MLEVEKIRAVLVLALFSALVIIAVPILGVKAQETLIWEADVDSTGGAVISPLLEAGTEYRIVATGIWTSCDPWTGVFLCAADALYYTPGPVFDLYNWNPANTFSALVVYGHSFLQINGIDVDWGPFSNVIHEYTIYYTGTDAEIIFTIYDWFDDDFTNNICHIHVQIYAPPPTEEGLSPGYWKKAFNYFADVLDPPKKSQGAIKETWADLMAWTLAIDSASRSVPTPWDLPPLAEIDYDSDGTFEMEDAYNIFNDHGKPWNTLWIDVANWYNWAAGYGYYNG